MVNPGECVEKKNKFGIRGKTLDDKIVVDSLNAVSTLTDKEPYCVVGGIATQTYVTSGFRRSTSDVDLSVGMPLNYTQFQKLFAPVVEYLRDHHYSVSFKKGSRAYALHVLGPEGEREIIEASRRNEAAFSANENRLMREIQNARRKIVNGGDGLTVVIAAAEDIILPKSMRTVNSMKRNQGFVSRFGKNAMDYAANGARQVLDAIEHLREEALLNVGDPRLAEELRFDSDIYDIRCLSTMAGINPQYLRNAFSSWEALREQSPERDTAVRTLLPSFHLDA